MAHYSIKVDLLPGYGYSSNALYYDANTTKDLNTRIRDLKGMSAAYRISINGKVAYESKGSGAKKKWYKR